MSPAQVELCTGIDASILILIATNAVKTRSRVQTSRTFSEVSQSEDTGSATSSNISNSESNAFVGEDDMYASDTDILDVYWDNDVELADYDYDIGSGFVIDDDNSDMEGCNCDEEGGSEDEGDLEEDNDTRSSPDGGDPVCPDVNVDWDNLVAASHDPMHPARVAFEFQLR